MGSEALLEGKCVIWKNKTQIQSFQGAFTFDDDLRRFKILGDGAVAFAFGPLQIKDIDYERSGAIKKRTSMGIYVNFPNGDEYLFDVEYQDEAQFKSVDSFISRTITEENAREEILRLMKSRDRVTVDEVLTVLKKYGVGNDPDFARSLIDKAISEDKVQGTFNGTEFLNKSNPSNISVRYNVAVKLEFTSSGALTLKCPGCGSALPIQKKESNIKCSYCGQDCFIPSKVLDLI